MKHIKSLLVASVAVGLLVAAVPAQAEMKGEANIFLGIKSFSEDQFDSVEIFDTTLDVSTATEYGVAFSFGKVDWPVMIAVDVLKASEDDSASYDYGAYAPYRYKVEIDTTELNLGVRKFWTNNDKFQPYVGGGIAWIDAKADLTASRTLYPDKQITDTLGASDSDSGIGYWLNGGVLWRLRKGFSLGIDIRYTDADADWEFAELDDAKQAPPDSEAFDTGGFHYGLLAGYRW